MRVVKVGENFNPVSSLGSTIRNNLLLTIILY